jgi:hypothetical protein
MARGGRRAVEWARWATSPSGPDTLVGQQENERRSRPAALPGWARGQLGRRGKFSKESSRVVRNVWAEIRSGS